MNSGMSPLSESLLRLVSVEQKINELTKKESSSKLKNKETDDAINKVFIGVQKNGEIFVEKKSKGLFARISRALSSITKKKDYDANKSLTLLKQQFNEINRASEVEVRQALDELHTNGLAIDVKDVKKYLDEFRMNMQKITSHIKEQEFERRPGYVSRYKPAEESWRNLDHHSTLRTLDLELIGTTPLEKFQNLIARYSADKHYVFTKAIENSNSTDCRALLEKILDRKVSDVELRSKRFRSEISQPFWINAQTHRMFDLLLSKAKKTASIGS